jgi:hypothetical protein
MLRQQSDSERDLTRCFPQNCNFYQCRAAQITFYAGKLILSFQARAKEKKSDWGERRACT